MNQYSVDFKLKIVKMILNEHISKKSIMREYNVATKTQRQRVHKYQREGKRGLVSKRKKRDKKKKKCSKKIHMEIIRTIPVKLETANSIICEGDVITISSTAYSGNLPI